MINNMITHVVDHDGRTLIVKNAPCLECEKCGATYFEGHVAKRLEKIIDKLKSINAELVVVKYTATD